MKDCKLMSEQGKTIAMGSRDMIFRYIKHHVADGMYAIEGPDIDMSYYRIEGVIFPCGGTQDGVKMPPRSREECQSVFLNEDGDPNEIKPDES